MARPNRSQCTEDHEGQVSPDRILALPESQAGRWRHKCPACAYLMGLQDGLSADMRARVAKDLVAAKKRGHRHAN